MTAARKLFYLHILVAVACIGAAIFALNRRTGLDWQFNRKLERWFKYPPVNWLYFACLLSCLVFPVAVSYKTVGRMAAWRWWPIVVIEVVLSFAQFLALMELVPVRS